MSKKMMLGISLMLVFGGERLLGPSWREMLPGGRRTSAQPKDLRTKRVQVAEAPQQGRDTRSSDSDTTTTRQEALGTVQPQDSVGSRREDVASVDDSPEESFQEQGGPLVNSRRKPQVNGSIVDDGASLYFGWGAAVVF